MCSFRVASVEVRLYIEARRTIHHSHFQGIRCSLYFFLLWNYFSSPFPFYIEYIYPCPLYFDLTSHLLRNFLPGIQRISENMRKFSYFSYIFKMIRFLKIPSRTQPSHRNWFVAPKMLRFLSVSLRFGLPFFSICWIISFLCLCPLFREKNKENKFYF